MPAAPAGHGEAAAGGLETPRGPPNHRGGRVLDPERSGLGRAESFNLFAHCLLGREPQVVLEGWRSAQTISHQRVTGCLVGSGRAPDTVIGHLGAFSGCSPPRRRRLVSSTLLPASTGSTGTSSEPILDRHQLQGDLGRARPAPHPRPSTSSHADRASGDRGAKGRDEVESSAQSRDLDICYSARPCEV